MFQGVDTLVKYMSDRPDKVASGLGRHRLMLATVDAAWCCAVGCFTTEDLLLEKEGVFLLIDLLQVGFLKCVRQSSSVCIDLVFLKNYLGAVV